MDNRASVPEIRLQPESVDFIENELDGYHPGFANPPSHYNPQLGGFVVDMPLNGVDAQTLAAYNRAQWALTGQGVAPVTYPPVRLPPTLAEAEQKVLPARKRAEPIAALEFWDDLFAPSMDRFVKAHATEPDEVKQRCRIRDQTDWTGVFDRLEAAKTAYCQTDNSFKATFRKVYRKTADHSGGAPMAIVDAAKDLLDVDYASPVLGALRLVLDVSVHHNVLLTTINC